MAVGSGRDSSDGVGAGQNLFRQNDAEGPLDTCDELHPGEAVETEIAVQRAVQAGPESSGPPRPQFIVKGLDHCQKTAGRVTTLVSAERVLRLRQRTSFASLIGGTAGL